MRLWAQSPLPSLTLKSAKAQRKEVSTESRIGPHVGTMHPLCVTGQALCIWKERNQKCFKWQIFSTLGISGDTQWDVLKVWPTQTMEFFHVSRPLSTLKAVSLNLYRCKLWDFPLVRSCQGVVWGHFEGWEIEMLNLSWLSVFPNVSSWMFLSAISFTAHIHTSTP